MLRPLLLLACAAAALGAAPKVLFVSHSAGYRHGSIETARDVLQKIGSDSRKFEVTATEDLSLVSAAGLREFDAVFFFTSGELALSSEQKGALLDFVRSGKGFGGAHSATDTLYGWPDYGEMIGGYFDGHPWTQEARINVEEPEHPFVKHIGNSYRWTEEFYQFRAFSRERVRVLMTLDTTSVDMKAAGVNRTDGDFPLAWLRPYGQGRVFYTALGHFEETWKDSRFQTTLLQAMLWLTGQAEAESAPRRAAPAVWKAETMPQGVENVLAPGALFRIVGTRLSPGSSARAESLPLPASLAGVSLLVDGATVPLVSVTPDAIEAQAPLGLRPGVEVSVVVAADGVQSAPLVLPVFEAVPRIVTAIGGRSAGWVALFTTGMGAVEPSVEAGAAAPASALSVTTVRPSVTVGGVPVEVYFSGLAPGWAGVYQVNAAVPSNLPLGPLEVVVQAAGRQSNAVWID
ncbi:MAG TPA: ThuA domain-containing protein [Bryobacteraceae bacterium]|nr:ThuA domain-containing protein [Bryobacteraceae bacterium]